MTDTFDIATFGAYETREFLGMGSFAEVYRCYHADLDTEVAVKVLHRHLSRQPDVRERFLQEARILWRAEHPRVIPVHHVDVLPSGQPYFVMRLAECGSLGSQIERRMVESGGPFELPAVVGLAGELAECLDAVRARGVVHRDLKPENVLVRRVRTPDPDRVARWGLPADERLTLADFGLAKVLAEGTSMLSQLGGTPHYMAPEQMSLTARLDWRADLFAVGVMTFELAVGEVPWPERTVENARDIDLDLVDAHERSGGTVPIGFDDVIRRAVMHDPEDRYESPSAFVDALTELVVDDAVDDDEPMTHSIIERIRILADGLDDSVRRGDRPVRTLVADALDRPRRLVVVGGERTTPDGLTLRMLGRRVEPGRGSLLGHRVTRIRQGDELRLLARTLAGDEVLGHVDHDDSGRLRLELAVSPWSVDTLELELPGDHFGGVELVDVPWSVVRAEAGGAAAFIREADLVVLGLPMSTAVAAANLDTLLGLLLESVVGPVGVVGVQAAASFEQMPLRLPGTLEVLSSDDAAELRALTDDVLGGERGVSLAASRALALLAPEAERFDDELDAIRRDAPELDRLIAARSVVVQRSVTVDERDELVHLLGRRAPQTRLGLAPDADPATVRRVAAERRRRWEWARSRATSGGERARILDAALGALGGLIELSEGAN
ncbi:MAG: serine/threonine-protein kinase [Acidimicrobiales bacterium]